LRLEKESILRQQEREKEEKIFAENLILSHQKIIQDYPKEIEQAKTINAFKQGNKSIPFSDKEQVKEYISQLDKTPSKDLPLFEMGDYPIFYFYDKHKKQFILGAELSNKEFFTINALDKEIVNFSHYINRIKNEFANILEQRLKNAQKEKEKAEEKLKALNNSHPVFKKEQELADKLARYETLRIEFAQEAKNAK
ncbi:hypothetical protein CCZ01_09910, partial [Helicobacter monodelphidis]|uniref:hypothetical protein n=1 Tax=Helicobacter sp. 15-1451 TaxID=2004995 RepID=UPI000DCDED74